jgi:toxin ParE1/3/4
VRIKYRFYPSADAAQDSIWIYTCDKWGEVQAEKYIKELHTHIAKLADKNKPWKQLPQNLVVPSDLKIKVYFSQYKNHYIFFRELSDGILGIMSILHEKMDLPVRLSQDLEKIQSDEK